MHSQGAGNPLQLAPLLVVIGSRALAGCVRIPRAHRGPKGAMPLAPTPIRIFYSTRPDCAAPRIPSGQRVVERAQPRIFDTTPVSGQVTIPFDQKVVGSPRGYTPKPD